MQESGIGHIFSPGARKRPSAMTLLELLVVVLLLSIISGVLIMRLGQDSIGDPGARAVARRLSLDLDHARSLAVSEGMNHYLGFDADGSNLLGYGIYRRSSPSDIAVESYRQFGRGVSASSATTRAEFEPTGNALGTYSFVVSGPSKDYTVMVIAATGTTTVSEP